MVGAIVLPSIASAGIGVICLAIWAVWASGPLAIEGPSGLLLALVATGFGLAFATIAMTFVVAFYLLVFGLPVALLMGERIRHPLALLVSLADAIAAALIALTGSIAGVLSSDGDLVRPLAMVLCFALPAGYLYRRTIIAERDIAEFF